MRAGSRVTQAPTLSGLSTVIALNATFGFRDQHHGCFSPVPAVAHTPLGTLTPQAQRAEAGRDHTSVTSLLHVWLFPEPAYWLHSSVPLGNYVSSGFHPEDVSVIIPVSRSLTE